MAVARRKVRDRLATRLRRAVGALALVIAAPAGPAPALAQAPPAQVTPAQVPPAQAPDASVSAERYTWIFFGELPTTEENLSGTLVAGAAESQFELRLGGGATCDGTRLDDEIGVVRLHELTCSDGRRLRALFVAEGGTTLRVFGTIDEDEFIADAHLLDLDAPLDAATRDRWPPALPPVPKQPIAAP